MKSWLCSIGFVAIAICAGVACSSSDTPPPAGGSGAGGTGGSGDDGGTSTTVGCSTVNDHDTIMYTGTMPPVYTCNGSKSTNYPDGPSACRNTSDCAIIQTTVPGGVRDLVRTCALSYRDKEPPMGATPDQVATACAEEASLNTACVKDATATKIMQPGISGACGQCYTAIALCSIGFCLSECAADADAIECVKCQFASGCRVPFERCSGLDRQ